MILKLTEVFSYLQRKRYSIKLETNKFTPQKIPLTNGSVAQVKLGAGLLQVTGAAIFWRVDGAV